MSPWVIVWNSKMARLHKPASLLHFIWCHSNTKLHNNSYSKFRICGQNRWHIQSVKPLINCSSSKLTHRQWGHCDLCSVNHLYKIKYHYLLQYDAIAVDTGVKTWMGYHDVQSKVYQIHLRLWSTFRQTRHVLLGFGHFKMWWRSEIGQPGHT